MNIKVKYFDYKMPKLIKTQNGDWIDLSVVKATVVHNDELMIANAFKQKGNDGWDCTDDVYFGKGDIVVMRLGVGIQLPANKKAQVIPRSSTFKTYGLILTNSVGAIDNKYQGDNDEWLAVFYATRNGFITKYDRICQFDIVDRMDVMIEEVYELGEVSRGGYGTSGKQ